MLFRDTERTYEPVGVSYALYHTELLKAASRAVVAREKDWRKRCRHVTGHTVVTSASPAGLSRMGLPLPGSESSYAVSFMDVASTKAIAVRIIAPRDASEPVKLSVHDAEDNAWSDVEDAREMAVLLSRALDPDKFEDIDEVLTDLATSNAKEWDKLRSR